MKSPAFCRAFFVRSAAENGKPAPYVAASRQWPAKLLRFKSAACTGAPGSMRIYVMKQRLAGSYPQALHNLRESAGGV
jgi:hypothetical protein